MTSQVRVLKLSQEEAEKIADSLWYRHTDGTVIAVVQDVDTKEVLMVAHMNREAVIKTLTTGLVHFWSTSRKKLWLKGETSGNYQYLVEFRIDCDRDAVLLLVKPAGPACHLGLKSCFDNECIMMSESGQPCIVRSSSQYAQASSSS